MKKLFLIISTICFLFTATITSANIEIKTDNQKLSYAMGAYFSQGIKQQAEELDIDVFLQAVEDVLKGSDLKLSQNEIQTALVKYQQAFQEKRASTATENMARGKAFLAKNKSNKDVVTLESGLQYKILKQGSGEKPSKGGSVKVHYHGTLLDGQVFDSSYERGEPISLSLTRVIPAWQEAVPMMPVGSKWQIYVPSDLGYGEQGAGGVIGPNETLIFDIELLAIE